MKHEWQPIETAPKDGTRFLATGRQPFRDGTSHKTIEIAWYADYKHALGLVLHTDRKPYDGIEAEYLTYWQPLPDIPLYEEEYLMIGI